MLGGTSAGLHVLGGWDSYTAIPRGTDILSKPNPSQHLGAHGTTDYDLDWTWNAATLQQREQFVGVDFLQIGTTANVLTESHFSEKDRMARFITFLANINAQNQEAGARGIAIDEGTALLVDNIGNASVAGSGHVYFVKASQMPVTVQGTITTPLDIDGVQVNRFNPGGAQFSFGQGWDYDNSTSAHYTLKTEPDESGQIVVNETQPGGPIY